MSVDLNQSVPHFPRTSHVVGLVIGVVSLLSVVSYTIWAAAFLRSNKILPGVEALGTPIGGLSVSDAAQALHIRLEPFLGYKVTFAMNGSGSFTLGPAGQFFPTSQWTDIALAAQAIGRDKPWYRNILLPLITTIRHTAVAPNLIINLKQLDESLSEALSAVANDNIYDLTAPENARFSFTADTHDRSSCRIVDVLVERPGIGLDRHIALAALSQALASANTSTVNLPTISTVAAVTADMLRPFLSQAQQLVGGTPLKIIAPDGSLSITACDVTEWLTIDTSTTTPRLVIAWKALPELERLSASQLNRAIAGSLTLNANGQLLSFVAPVEGTLIDVTSTLDLLTASLANGSLTMSVIFQTVAPPISGDAEHLGIREVIGIGRSNFAGSPNNRRKNIILGAKTVHGTIIQTGEEFSMIKTLGLIDGEHGWLPELVIKGNKTTPEFGGGLCQIGTTAFRAALNSGLQITERRNHSYRVRYYEPAGTDATIYDPSPDFKFRNDTKAAILITTEVRGDKVSFTFWGTRDGRVVEQSTPRITNIVPAPAKKVIETTELKPGEEKCTEKEHAGADAQFDYSVTYSDGSVDKRTFFSRYRPWQAVCLVGVDKLSEPLSQEIDETGTILQP